MDILALALISGGLDSILAAKIMAEHPGIKVVGYNFHHLFESTPRADGLFPAEHAAFEAGISLIEDTDDRGFLDMIISPKMGRGKGANPCRDCKAFILRRAERMMNMVGGKFLITGEVVGQRPMSQMRNYINQIENSANLRGKIVRPLSGKILPPTEAEVRGWIDRERLLSLSGRGRKNQMELAAKFGITDFPAPAGGCLITQKSYGERFLDILSHEGRIEIEDIHLIKNGRFYRLPGGLRVIIARDEEESNEIAELAAGKKWIIYTETVPGPTAALSREPHFEERETAARLVASHGKGAKAQSVRMVLESPNGTKKIIDIEPALKEEFRDFLIL